VLDAGLLNPGLDVATMARRLAERGRVQIRSALRPDAASFLAEALAGPVPWSLAWRDREGQRKTPLADIEAMDPEQRRRWNDEFDGVARDGFQYSYLTWMMITGYMNDEAPDSPLNRVVELLNRGDWLEPMRAILDDRRPVKTSCQATRYRPGDFLAVHNDHSSSELRYAAYVINLGCEWQADHGGLLQFLDERGDVVETMVPHFNTISLFRTPQLHCVSPVARHAPDERLAITGWLMG
jgi:Rps23 Pro-64 3,4-dihydroxylase Tpa1-like proline 4-hydroxylase